MPDSCALCGIWVHAPHRRFQDAVELKAFVQKHCKPTPFLYKAMDDTPVGRPRVPLCIACVNWKRRCGHGLLKRNAKPFLQMDHLITYLLEPGKTPEPDRRCMQRLFVAI